MGAGIASVAVAGGYAVTLVEPDAAARARASARVPEASIVDAIPHDEEAAFAIEAVPEKLDLKRAVFASMARALPNAVLATNTSSLSVSEIAGALSGPERAVGLHFFNPPEKMRLVEVVRGTRSASGTIASARGFVERVGRTAILASDTPGFVVNRVARPYYLQALRALERNVATIEDLDALARGAGFRMGPFELMDFIGLDVNLATSESVYERTGAARFTPSALQRDLVARGTLGRKSGAGFYSYDEPRTSRDGAVAPRQRDGEARAVVLGTGRFADELSKAVDAHAAMVTRIEDLDEVATMREPLEIFVDARRDDGETDVSAEIVRAGEVLAPRGVILADAYATDIARCAKAIRNPERLVGYGVVGLLEAQRGVELTSPAASDAAIALARATFEAMGHSVVRVAPEPGLFLGRTICAIVNEAALAVEEGVASEDDVDLAMRLGTNYPRGPFAWGREIGMQRVRSILRRVAECEVGAYG